MNQADYEIDMRAQQLYKEWEASQPAWFQKAIAKRADIKLRIKVIIGNLLKKGELS